MKKKKIITVIAAVAVVASLALGSLAWFTSNDSVTNNFSTVSTNDPSNPDSGIKIYEDFDNTTAGNVLPGTNVKKLVQIQSTAKYDQFVRAKIEKVWKDKKGNIVDSYYIEKRDGKDDQGNSIKVKTTTYYNSTDKKITIPAGAEHGTLDSSLIQLDCEGNLTPSGKWLDNTAKDKDGYYYYNEILPAGAETTALLNSVTLDSKASNIYKGLNFDVVVTAEGIQSVNGAVKDAWKTAPGEITKLGGELKAK